MKMIFPHPVRFGFFCRSLVGSKLSGLLTVVAALQVLLLAPVFAAPPNDAFSGAIVLNGLPVSTTGSNEDATFQAGEPDPSAGDGDASIWWRWTAASAGWVQVSTEGSGVDTILAVYSGTALSSLNLIASNDDAGSSRTSRLKFNAAAGVSYRIQVMGFEGEFGDIDLALQATTAPSPPVLQKLTVEPAAANITLNSAQVEAEITFTAADTLADLILLATGPDGDTFETFFEGSELDPVTGTLQNGTFRFPVRVPQARAGGAWKLSVQLWDAQDETSRYGGTGQTGLPEGSTAFLNLTNTGAVDSNPPTASLATLTPDPVNITEGDQEVLVRVTASDDVGIDRIEVGLYSQGGVGIDFFELGAGDLVSGNRQSGVWEGIMIVPAFLAPGNYDVDYTITDDSDRFQFFSVVGTDHPPGVKPVLTILNTGVVDLELPDVSAFTFSPANLSTGQLPVQVPVTLQATDDTRVLSASVVVEAPDGDGYFRTTLVRTGGTPGNGIWTGVAEIGTDYPPGSYRVGVELSDGINDPVFFGTQYADFLPMPPGTPAALTVIEGPGGDAYSVWKSQFAGLAGPAGALSADPEGDSWPNVIEFLSGTHPLLPSFAAGPDPAGNLAPVVRLDGQELVLEYHVDAANTSLGSGTTLTIQPQRSAQPDQNWQNVTATPVPGRAGFWRVAIPISGGPRQFLRLLVP